MTGMARRTGLAAVAAGLLAIAAPAGPALACACCSDPGTRNGGTGDLNDYIAGELAGLRLDAVAGLYLTACGFECVTGIDALAETYTVGLSKDGRRWSIAARDDGTGATGALEFVLPDRFGRSAIDPAPEVGNRVASLYKEWHLVAPVTGSGLFRPIGAGTATATLILHGTGNACDSAGDFTHWTLDVTGPGADFRFFGKLRPPG